MKTILIIILIISSKFAGAQNQNDEALIRKARETSNQSIAKQDVEGISKLWVDDYMIIRGSGTMELGKEANKTDWKNTFKENPKTNFERIPSEIIISKNNPNMAWETGVWKGFNTYSKGGRYSAQWKRKDGEWKIQAELFVALEK